MKNVSVLGLRIQSLFADMIHYTYLHTIPKPDVFIFPEIRKSDSDYNSQTHQIRIFNVFRDSDEIIIDSIQNVALHCTYVLYQQTARNDVFYKEYHNILSTGIRMGLWDAELIQTILTPRIISRLKRVVGPFVAIPDISYKKNRILLQISNCFSYPKILVDLGYLWNEFALCWEKELTKEAAHQEIMYIRKLSADIQTKHTTMLDCTIYQYLTVIGQTYPIRQLLHMHGFTYNWYPERYHKKMWLKRIQTSRFKEELPFLQEISQRPGVHWELLR